MREIHGQKCLKFGQEIYPYDENFKSVSDYAIGHKIHEKRAKKLNHIEPKKIS